MASPPIRVIGKPSPEWAPINWLAVRAIETRVGFFETDPPELAGVRERRRAFFKTFFLVDRRTTLREFVDAVFMIAYHEQWIKDFNWNVPQGNPDFSIDWQLEYPPGLVRLFWTNDREDDRWHPQNKPTDLVGDYKISPAEQKYRDMVMKTGREMPRVRVPTGDTDETFYVRRPWDFAKGKTGMGNGEGEEEGARRDIF